MAKRPEVLLCDEPTGALDAETGTKVLAALETTHRVTGTTTAVITHNSGIARMANRILRMADGRIASVEENRDRLPPEAIEW